ncbi:MAG: carboxypeptidase-like regulatory domain-containing protein [Cyclobacteriaceae bacterium]|nr:carboxypeptidase-like regulatory domain-containing protein [Cyclobacteriaceae bacterium]
MKTNLQVHLILNASLLLTLFCLTYGNLWAQTRTVSGTIIAGDTGEPLPGVNILVQGTTRGSITDIDGNY